ncbi:ATP-binding protein [Oerskovia sp. Sa1BUA8]|uniref:ATP-binding protein n=1 Tax=Oerskovia douganii TaxID=2762210 RepID=A0A9D5U822_9CELL|nr:ATP-binding protein [Oerskovia douganii]
MILMCGPAGSGKSTYARGLERDGYVLLSFDDEAWQRGHRDHPVPEDAMQSIHEHLQNRLTELVTSGARVVVDTSFWSKSSRDRYRDLLAPLGVTPTIYYLDTPTGVLLERIGARTNAGPNDVHVALEQAHAYINGFQIPTPDEGPLHVIRYPDA